MTPLEEVGKIAEVPIEIEVELDRVDLTIGALLDLDVESVIAMPSDAELTAYTTSVAQNNRLHIANGPNAPSRGVLTTDIRGKGSAVGVTHQARWGRRERRL